MSIVINFTLANSMVSNDSLLNFITNQETNAQIYKLTPPNGKHISAATDWKAIVGTVADGLTILTSLWTFYSEFIKPKKTEESTSGIYITIQVDNSVNDIWIGNDINSKEELIAKYKDSVKASKIDSTKNYEIEDSTIWKKIK
ncbi:hypothetical protein [Chryseobacterium timonianum]|uniref:hypothetical protein n=1 Tax=Chryseobacterium timonianum TaxID=1805473 RepID=UPI001F4B0814|nr:hypothetical protein [Chryseobacterium timonianum]